MAKKSFISKNISVEWDWSLKEKVEKEFSNRQLQEVVQSTIIPMIKDSISKGLSPVEGKRMFNKYKDPKKYPAKMKQSNKPNLYLSGHMLAEYKAKANKDPMEISVGIHNDASKEIKIRAEANNNGTEHIPARRFVPWAGENFIRKITLETKKIFAEALGQALKRGRNK